MRHHSLTILIIFVLSAVTVLLIPVWSTHIQPENNDKPLYVSPNPTDKPYCGLVALKILLAAYDIEYSLPDIASIAGVNSKGTSVEACLRTAAYLGVPSDLKLVTSMKDFDGLKPHILILDSPGNKHAIVIFPGQQDRLTIVDGPAIIYLSVDDITDYFPCVAIVPRASMPLPKGETCYES